MDEMQPMHRMYNDPNTPVQFKQEVCEIEEKRYRFSRQVQWNQSVVLNPANVCNPLPQQGPSMMSDGNGAAYRFQRAQAEPKMWPASMLSTLEENIKSLVQESKATCEALCARLKTSTENYEKQIAGYCSTIDELAIQRDSLMLERNLANLAMLQLEAKQKQTLIELECEWEKKQNIALAQLRMQHDIDLKNEKEQMSTQIDRLKKEIAAQMLLAENVTILENLIEAKNNIIEEIESKYEKMLADINAKAELDRAEFEQQNRGMTRCTCCGATLKVKLFCNEQCAEMW